MHAWADSWVDMRRRLLAFNSEHNIPASESKDVLSGVDARQVQFTASIEEAFWLKFIGLGIDFRVV